MRSRKYLGDPGSPHFIPESPFIDRQFLSHEEELRLKRACVLALKDIQCSDDDEIDPTVAYLAGHIRERNDSQDIIDSNTIAPALVSVKPLDETSDAASKHFSHPFQSDNQTSTSTSEKACADNTDRGAAAGLLGQSHIEDVKRTSGPKFGLFTMKRGSNSSHSDTADPKSSERATAWMLTYLEKRMSKDRERDSIETRRPGTANARASTSRPSTHRTTSKGRVYGDSCRASGSMSAVDVNKRLPALPRGNDEPEVPKTEHITRLMKNIKKPKKHDETQPSANDLQEPARHELPAEHPERKTAERRSFQPRVDSLRVELLREPLHPPRSGSLPAQNITIEPDSSLPYSTPAKRRFFSKRLAERFDWKRRKIPMPIPFSTHGAVAAPVLQVA